MAHVVDIKLNSVLTGPGTDKKYNCCSLHNILSLYFNRIAEGTSSNRVHTSYTYVKC